MAPQPRCMMCYSPALRPTSGWIGWALKERNGGFDWGIDPYNILYISIYYTGKKIIGEILYHSWDSYWFDMICHPLKWGWMDWPKVQPGATGLLRLWMLQVGRVRPVQIFCVWDFQNVRWALGRPCFLPWTVIGDACHWAHGMILWSVPPTFRAPGK